MDQFPFEFKITVIGLEVDDFIVDLRSAGYEHQADEVQKQFENQIKDI